MASKSHNPVDSVALPEPLARLRYRELIFRLNHAIGPDDRYLAQLLVYRFFEVARKWEGHRPGTSISIYSAALKAISKDGLFSPAAQILKKIDGEEAGLQSAGLALIWLTKELQAVSAEKLALIISVSDLLLGIFEEKAP